MFIGKYCNGLAHGMPKEKGTNHTHNFTRILHNYTDERKVFIIWKDLLEEVLV